MPIRRRSQPPLLPDASAAGSTGSGVTVTADEHRSSLRDRVEPLPRGVVRLWVSPVGTVSAGPFGRLESEAHRVLSAAELTRAPHGAHRTIYLLAHLSLRRVLGEQLRVDPARVSLTAAPCSVCGRPHGKPIVAGTKELHLSLSHTRGLAVIALSSEPVDGPLRRSALLGFDRQPSPVAGLGRRATLGLRRAGAGGSATGIK